MDVRKALDLVEQLETGICEMYANLQAMFSNSDSKDLEMFFYRLYLEGTNHVNLVRTEKKRIQAGPEDANAVDISPDDFKKVIDQVAVVRGMPRDKITEIMIQCYLIESTMAEQYVVAALKISREEVRLLFEMLGKGFRDHLAALAVRVKDLGADMTNLDVIRRCPRVSYSGRAIINEKTHAKSVDISETGIFLLTTQTFPEGSTLELSFPLMGVIVATRARVRYSVRNAGIGLSFDHLEEEQRALIQEYVDCIFQKIPVEIGETPAVLDDDHSGTA